MDDVRLIDANALKEKRQCFDCHECGDDCEIDCVEWEDIENAPTIDAVPVVHGRWVKMHRTGLNDGESVWNCSACGYPVGIWTVGSKYCPNCGAKMDGGASDD